MPVISFCGESFTVDHAVKGADYVHGYDENSNLIVSLEGITDFSGISYDGEYMAPDSCLTERCNDVKYCGGSLKKRDGTALTPEDLGALPLSGGTVTGSIVIDNNVEKQIRFKNDGTGPYTHNCTIYQGSPNSGAGLGSFDTANQRYIWMYNDVRNFLQLGGTDTGIVLQNGSYGDELPDPGTPGRIFFKRVT